MDQYPHIPGHKATGTSEQAAVEMTSKAGTLRNKILDVMRRTPTSGYTADEMADHLGESVLSIRPRFSELLANKQIYNSGLARTNRSGKSATVWKVGQHGEQISFL